MKTSEQTKRAISVGLINTARAVIVSATTLFCGVTSARAQEPDNRIDWQWGRPGVMVVTNAPTAVTVTNIATDVAGGVANTTFGPRVTALEDVLGGNTNNWNTAYGWGNHAWLYRSIDWAPSWADVTGKPDLFDWNYDSLTNVPATFPPDAHTHSHTDITDPPWLTEYVETDAIALAALAAHAAYWPPNATASSWFTFITNSGAITITGYNIDGGTDVVIIPDYINGLPVTEIGANAFEGSGVTSIGGAGNVATVGAFAFNNCGSLAAISLPQVQTAGDSAFNFCPLLASVSLPQVQTVGAYAFNNCGSLAAISLPQVQTVGNSAFGGCQSLTSVSLPQVQTVGLYAFGGCFSLTSVSLPQAQTVGPYAFESCYLLTSLYFDNDAPTIGAEIFAGIIPNQVKNYVTNPTATGWGATIGEMPVVRLPLHTDALTLGGVTHTNWPSADVSGLAGTNSPTILNPTVHGWLALPQSAPTNLVLRLVCSNEHIYVEEVYQ